MLTRKQHELLMFIHERVRETGVPPSFDEMKDALDLKSKSGIHRLITALEERGFLRRMEKRARALEIIRLPENVADTLRPATTRSQAQRIAVHAARLRAAARARPPIRAAAAAPGATSREGAINVPCLAASRPARRSRRCSTRSPTCRCPRACSAAAIITRSK